MLTPLQEYVIKNGYAKIGEELGIKTYEHHSLPLVGFQYDQVASPKLHPVVRWSRGTVLEKQTYRLIAQPFVRFYDYGDNQQELKRFNWSDFLATTKHDGSLMIVYHYRDEWRLNTSGSFGLGPHSRGCDETWETLFWSVFEQNGGLKAKLDPGMTYIFELCSLKNTIVRLYPHPMVYLLSVFHGDYELPWCETCRLAKEASLETTTAHRLGSLNEVKDFLIGRAEVEATFEGLVLRDSANIRFKIKTRTYEALHHLKDDGGARAEEYLVQVALGYRGDLDHLGYRGDLDHLPKYAEKFRGIQTRLSGQYGALLGLWHKTKGIGDRKEFAMAVKDHKYSPLLFAMRKLPEAERTDRALARMWSEAADLVWKTWDSPQEEVR